MTSTKPPKPAETAGDRARRERAAQGLPPTVEDPAVLDKIAAIMIESQRRAARMVGRRGDAA